jgi:hypothetical protein
MKERDHKHDFPFSLYIFLRTRRISISVAHKLSQMIHGLTKDIAGAQTRKNKAEGTPEKLICLYLSLSLSLCSNFFSMSFLSFQRHSFGNNLASFISRVAKIIHVV